MFQIPVQNLDSIRKARKKVKGILVDLGLDSCRELLKNLKSFDPGEKHFCNTSWSDVSPWESVGKRKRYRTKPYCCSLCKFSSKLLTSFKNHLHRYHEDEMDQELVVPCPKCAFASDPKIVGKHIRMFHSSNKRIQNYTVSILDGMKQFRSDIINFTCLKCHFTDTLYYNMKKHVLMNHFQNLISTYFGQKPDESKENSIEHYCKKCNASANSQDSLMYHVLTAETHRDLENKLRSVISEHIKKPGLVKQMHIAPKPPQGVAVATPSAGPAAAPAGSVTAPACIQLAFPQNNQNQSVVQPKAVQNTIRSLPVPSASGSLPHTTSAPVATPSHVTLVSSNLSVGQNSVNIQPSPSQPIIVSHRLPLNQPVRAAAIPLNHSVGTVNRTLAPAVLPLNQPVRPGLFPVNQPIGTINGPVAAGMLPVTQPVSPVNGPVAPAVLPVNGPVAPGVLSVNQSLGNVNTPIGPRVLPVAQTVASGVLQLNQPVASGVVPVRQPVRPGFLQLNQPVAPAVIPVNQPVQPAVSQNTTFLTAGSILRQLIPTGKQVNGIPTYTLAPVSVTLPVPPGGGVATVTPPQVPIQLMQSGTVTQLSQPPAGAPSPPVVLTSQNISLQASPPGPETSQAIRQAKQWKTCPVCNELFPSNVYQVHMEVAHKHGEVKMEETLEPDKLAACAPFLRWMTEKTVRCFSCKCFLCEEELMKHLLMHGLACLFCTVTFHDLKSLVEHNKTTHNGKKQLHADYSNRGFQLGNDAQGDLVFPHFDFSTVLPKEDIGEREVHLAVLAGLNSRTLVPVYIKVKPQTAEVNSRCNKKVLTCPFCFGTFVSKETYEMHLKERHHIMPTVHTILKSPAFKCIHCCGVYTGNMTLTAIAVHLLRCRSAPKDSNSSVKMQLECTERKELLFVNGEKHDSVILKRKQSDSCFVAEHQRNKEQQPLSLSTGIALSPEKEVNSGVVPFKRQKINSRTEMKKLPSSEDLRILAVDPKQYDYNSYEAQNQFLTDYFHERPYPSKKEMELLSSLLYAWKIDVASFFGKRRNICLKAINNQKASVLLGFSMSELKNIKHSLNIKDEPLDM
ncbi:activity-dependent neuroprotector homeobox protein 2 isoform X1 [Rissa tridactyla]|uniref:activity-dependent neuroprotector homeobox protein 2 isoform X1 n=2 Tax=Rissa tridactyla TaxID=75485 RepID=UPI0023BABDFC|nr:activity-dependent neuroprotector homeobox protein 2 isoform X1 [Rissa tridactyla]XP_054045835.1 activity-dependent neuroprotector homeobox protein 2 isoform X1 [Rissa tridactyla]XP_054045836.1 activity-dependent neuroprotector homeobox protein 2 isoform X1 [Rissa tridactyla]XP_054045837.1 activity-dependent neuroprotector homeobox protein 2 isoform X1 [Rissa tridactyla]XP_054045838.1 activity-dependent neuroprotector homeobox protein 2 isoform X1 [Rissa tridactyla]XP_054045839.1 activity-d